MLIRVNFIVWFSVVALHMQAQLANDECRSAVDIGSRTTFCGLFSTIGSTASEEDNISCWPNGSVSDDVWFSFRAVKGASTIRVLLPPENTPLLQEISIALYEGRCSNLVDQECASNVDNAPLELFANSLVIGREYFIRIDSRTNETGNFELCLDQFDERPAPQQDCDRSVILCDKSGFNVESLEGAGLLEDEADDTCLDTDPTTGTDDGDSESRSAWYTWTCKDAGTLTFTLTPSNSASSTEDLDFALYRLPDGLADCNNKELLRCMASGETVGAPIAQNAPCFGETGLRAGSTDFTEERGCELGSDNFLAPINMEEGESYTLVVNNFSPSRFGFSIEFGGTGTFLGAEPDYEVIIGAATLTCDLEVMYEDLSLGITDPIMTWQWNFGEGAEPQFATGQGPHPVIYNSFGNKTTALTITTSRGCIVSETKDIQVEPCCDNNVSLTIAVDTINCFGEETGIINVMADGGDPEYLYTIVGEGMQFENVFTSLAAAEYSIFVQDVKGCEANTIVEVVQRPDFSVDAGPDQEIDLGRSTFLDAFVDMTNYNPSLEWDPAEFVDCFTCEDPEAFPMRPTRYTLTATNEFGCMRSDEVNISVSVDREGQVYAPEVFTPNGDGNNDFYKLFGGIAVESILELNIYNRWGNLMYTGRNLTAENVFNEGWDGSFNGQSVSAGVYAWVAEILYIDDQVETLSGSLTLIR